MTGRRHRIAWWTLTGVFVAGLAGSLIAGPHLNASSSILLAFIAYGVVGALIASRRPGNVIGWVFLGIGALTGLFVIAQSAVDRALAQDGSMPWWGLLSVWFLTWFWFPLIFLCTTFTVLNYPEGLPSPRWRPVSWLAIFSVTAMTALTALSPEMSVDTDGNGPFVANPIAPTFLGDWKPVGSIPFAVAALLAVGCGLAAGVSVVVRARRATGVERLQLRWFAFAVALFVPLFLVSHGESFVGQLPITLGLAFIPISCGIAILRYRLYEIDRIVSRTTSYVLVIGVLLLVYISVVTAVSQLLPKSNDLAVAAATFAAAAVFRPVLSRVKSVVDRRFNRSRYDAQHTVDAFASRLRDGVDPDLVADDLIAVVGGTVQPASVLLWLRTS
jgi:hypothetical protein